MSRRIDQVNELIQREVAEHLREQVEFPRDFLVTVTHVITNPDLKHATVFVSVLPFAKNEHAMRVLAGARSDVQRTLNNKLHMHHIPQIQFVIDATEEKASTVEAILDDLHRKGEI